MNVPAASNGAAAVDELTAGHSSGLCAGHPHRDTGLTFTHTHSLIEFDGLLSQRQKGGLFDFSDTFLTRLEVS